MKMINYFSFSKPENLKRIFDSSYLPTDADIVAYPEKNNELECIEYFYSGAKFEYINITNLSSPRKWLHYFDTSTMIFYFVPLDW